MPLGLLGLKVGMTQVYDEKGELAPVTVLQVGPCPVLQVRNQERDGYDAVQLGFQDKHRGKATRPERGHVSPTSNRSAARSSARPACSFCPSRTASRSATSASSAWKAAAGLEVGKVLTADEVFKEVKPVDVIGTSKGRGMTGVMKRHNFGGLRHSHGVKKGSRQRGSIASNASNRGSGRPKKGIRMAGRYGNDRVTVRNLDVVRIDAENHVMLVRGARAGPEWPAGAGAADEQEGLGLSRSDHGLVGQA